MFSYESFFLILFSLFYSPIPTERSEVLIASPEEDIEVSKRCQELVANKIIRPDTLSQTDSRNCLFLARRIWNCSSCKTEPTAVRSLTVLVPARGKYCVFYIRYRHERVGKASLRGHLQEWVPPVAFFWCLRWLLTLFLTLL
jgi:hypothetical protein